MLMSTSVKITDNLITQSENTKEPNRNKVNNTINALNLQRLLDEKARKNLQTLEARSPNFNMQPKIHKKGNLSRPVISSVNCHTTKISQYADHLLTEFNLTGCDL